MNILRAAARHLRIRSRTLYNYYVFEKFGIPSVRDENISKSLLRPYLPSRPVIIDCGAHVGSDSVALAKLLKGTVHAFEPVPDIFMQLKKNASRYPSVICHSIALSSETGEAELYVSGGASDASSSLLKPQDHITDHPSVTFDQTISVKTQTLDEWASEQGLDKVDLLWLDMQGAELAMLKASETILPTVSAIHTEVSVKDTYEGVGRYDEVRSFLEEQGFKVVVEAIVEGADMGNVVFARTGTRG